MALSKIGDLRAQQQALKSLKPAAEENQRKKDQPKKEEEGETGLVDASVKLVVAVLKLVTKMLDALGNAAFGKAVEGHADTFSNDPSLMENPDAIDAKIADIEKEIEEEMQKALEQEEGQGMFAEAAGKAADMLGGALGLGDEKEKEEKEEGVTLDGGEELGGESESDDAPEEEQEPEQEQEGEEKSSFLEKIAKLIGKLFASGKGEEDIDNATEKSSKDLDKSASQGKMKAAASEAMSDSGASNSASATSIPSAKSPSVGASR